MGCRANQRLDGPQPFRGSLPSTTQAAPNLNRLLVLLCAACVAVVSAMGMLGPLLLQISDEFQVSLAQAGLLASATALPWALAAPLLGPLSDRYGRRRVLAASIGGLGIATLGGALATSFTSLLLIRVLSGIVASAGPTAQMAAVGDHFPPARRAAAYGWVNAGFGISALVGVPLVGAVAGIFGWRVAFVVTGLSCVTLAVLVWLWLPDSRGERTSQGGSYFDPYRAVLRVRRLFPILGANVLERSVFASVGLFLAPLLMQSYGIDLLGVAPLLAATAVGGVVGNVLGGRLADRFARWRVFGWGQLVAALLSLALFGLFLGPAASVLLGISFGLATSASRPAIITMASEVSAEHRGTALGLFSFTNQAGWAFGPAASGLCFALAGYPAIGLFCAAASLGAGLITLGLIRSGR